MESLYSKYPFYGIANLLIFLLITLIYYFMKNKLKQYLGVSKREFRGIMVILFIFILIYIAPYIYKAIIHEPLKISIETLQPKINEIEKFDEKKSYEAENEGDNFNNKITLFNFNPNNLPLDDWIKLGLSEKQARTIKNYEAKGGKFKSKADVKKMYSISSKQYETLEPYIQIPNQENKFEKEEKETNNYKPYEKPAAITVSVNINDADSTALTKIRGIGPAFASRIIKYRNRLGGFYKIEQLKEVYGIDSAKFEQIKSQIILVDINLKKININDCTFEDLKTFPYLTYKQSNAIIAYRKQHGNYKSFEDLTKIEIINSQLIQKIKPYLSF